MRQMQELFPYVILGNSTRSTRYLPKNELAVAVSQFPTGFRKLFLLFQILSSFLFLFEMVRQQLFFKKKRNNTRNMKPSAAASTFYECRIFALSQVSQLPLCDVAE